MKAIIAIIAILGMFVVFNYNANAQKVGVTYALTVDTVKGNENIYLTTSPISGNYSYATHQVLFTKVSAAAGGTAYFQGSVDGTSFQTINSGNEFIFFSNDTTTITDAGVVEVVVKGNPFLYYRWFIDGDADDTVIITPKYILKQ